METDTVPSDAETKADAPAGRTLVRAPSRGTSGGLTAQHAGVAEILAAEGRRGQRRRAWGMTVAGFAAIMVAGGSAWAWWAWQANVSPSYLTDAATRSDLVITLSATGSLRPTQQVGISSLVTGTIASVDVDYNDIVTRGQPLAHLDPTDYDGQRRRALAAVEAQAAARDVAATAVLDTQAAMVRIKRLPAGEMVSDRDVELATTALARARANLALAEAQLKASQADLAAAESNYAKTSIVSPIDGVVLDVSAQVGQTVSAATLATSLFILASDLRRLDLELDIDEADIPRVKAGDQASFTVESAPDRLLTGAVRQVRSAPTILDGVTSYKAIIEVDNTAGALRPGMTATADIQIDKASNALTVSNTALRFSPKGMPPRQDGGQQVYILHDGSLQSVPLTTGLSDGQRTEVLAGDLAPGDLVVTGTKDR